MDTATVAQEMEQAKMEFRQLLTQASPEELRHPTNGTRWNNRQLLFHMVFGYLIVRALLPLVHGFGRLPPAFSRAFAAVLNAGRRPFHLINYLGSWGGGQVLNPRAMDALLDRTMRALQHNLAAETDPGLSLSMHFPTSWDPYFKQTMSVLDVYHFGTQHFAHHRKQLTL